MSPDVHTDAIDHPHYLVESVYFDTPGFDCYYARGPAPLPKYRLRRYDGHSDTLYLEEKLRIGERVWKRRRACSESQSAAVRIGQPALTGEIEWFQELFQRLHLRSTVLLRYHRYALVGDAGERLTIDAQVTAARACGIGFATAGEEVEVLRLQVIELKWLGRPTALVFDLQRMLGGTTDACSKYGLSVRALGLRYPSGPAA